MAKWKPATSSPNAAKASLHRRETCSQRRTRWGTSSFCPTPPSKTLRWASKTPALGRSSTTQAQAASCHQSTIVNSHKVRSRVPIRIYQQGSTWARRSSESARGSGRASRRMKRWQKKAAAAAPTINLFQGSASDEIASGRILPQIWPASFQTLNRTCWTPSVSTIAAAKSLVLARIASAPTTA